MVHSLSLMLQEGRPIGCPRVVDDPCSQPARRPNTNTHTHTRARARTHTHRERRGEIGMFELEGIL